MTTVALVSTVTALGSGVDRARAVSSEPPKPTRCVPNERPGVPAPEAATSRLGATGLRYEAYAPDGRPRGVVILVHGGGWVDVGPGQMEFVRRTLSPHWLARGWATVISGYRGCRQSIDDVLALYDLVRARVGPSTPIGVVGESAGGHLALLLAAERGDLAFVAARAAPTSALQLGGEMAFDRATGGQDGTVPRLLAAGWRGTFGEREWRTRFNPLHRVREIRGRVLLAQSVIDPVIPVAQMTRMLDALRAARPHQWTEGVLLNRTEPFPHVAPTASLAEYYGAELRMIAPWQTGPPRTPPAVSGWWGETGPLWRGPVANPGTGRQCAAAPLLTRIERRGRSLLRVEGRGMPGAPVRLTAGRRTRTVAVSSDGTFRAQLRGAAGAERIVVAQSGTDADRSRVHALTDAPSVRARGGTSGGVAVTVRHPTSRTASLTVIDPQGCSVVRRAVRLGDRRSATATVAAAPGSYLLVAAGGRSGPARMVPAGPEAR